MKLTPLVFFLEQEWPFRHLQLALNNNSDVPGTSLRARCLQGSAGRHQLTMLSLQSICFLWVSFCPADIQCKSRKMRQHHAQLNSISSPIPTLPQRLYNLNVRGKSAISATNLYTPTSTPNFSLSDLFYLFCQPSHTRW